MAFSGTFSGVAKQDSGQIQGNLENICLLNCENQEIPRRGRSRGGRCANLSQLARRIRAKLPVFRFVHQRKGAQNCRKSVANLQVHFG